MKEFTVTADLDIDCETYWNDLGKLPFEQFQALELGFQGVEEVIAARDDHEAGVRHRTIRVFPEVNLGEGLHRIVAKLLGTPQISYEEIQQRSLYDKCMAVQTFAPVCRDSFDIKAILTLERLGENKCRQRMDVVATCSVWIIGSQLEKVIHKELKKTYSKLPKIIAKWAQVRDASEICEKIPLPPPHQANMGEASTASSDEDSSSSFVPSSARNSVDSASSNDMEVISALKKSKGRVHGGEVNEGTGGGSDFVVSEAESSDTEAGEDEMDHEVDSDKPQQSYQPQRYEELMVSGNRMFCCNRVDGSASPQSPYGNAQPDAMHLSDEFGCGSTSYQLENTDMAMVYNMIDLAMVRCMCQMVGLGGELPRPVCICDGSDSNTPTHL